MLVSEVPLYGSKPTATPGNREVVSHEGARISGGTSLLALKYKGTLLIRNLAPLGPYSKTMPRAIGLPYRGTSLIRNRHPARPYSRTTPRLLWRS